jgi:hypothetical protein
MKKVLLKVLLLVAVLFVVLPLSARPKLEISPRLSMHYSEDLIGGTRWSIGGDITLNPTNNIGLRVNMFEFLLGDPTFFSINMLNMAFLYNPHIDFLYYMNLAGLSSYIVMNFGLIGGEGSSIVAIGGGIGLGPNIGKKNSIFVEPGLILFSGSGDSELMIKVSGGIKFGIL